MQTSYMSLFNCCNFTTSRSALPDASRPPRRREVAGHVLDSGSMRRCRRGDGQGRVFERGNGQVSGEYYKQSKQCNKCLGTPTYRLAASDRRNLPVHYALLSSKPFFNRNPHLPLGCYLSFPESSLHSFISS